MRQILKFNDNWEFLKGVSEVNPAEVGESISLPHTWNALDGQMEEMTTFAVLVFTQRFSVPTSFPKLKNIISK